MKIKFLIICIFLTGTIFLNGQKTDMGLFHGIKPRNIGPAGMSGRVTAIAVDPGNYDILYIGTASGGLWKSVNAGTTFIPIFDDQPVASIGALAVDPLRHDIVWVGTGEGNPRNSVTGGYGIYKSLDGGKTWKLMGLQETRHIHRIIINPVNSDIVYVGALGTPWGPSAERGLYRTTDGGVIWQKILYTGETSGVCDMVIDPSNPDKLIVGMWNHQRWPWFFNSGGSGTGIYMTTDGGKSFTRLSSGLPEIIGRTGFAIAKSRPDYVYAYVESKPSAIYRSTDGGYTWERRGEKGVGTRPFYYAEIYVDPKNENRLYTLFSGINMSEDGGLTFSVPIGQSIHVDHHAWWINPDNPAHIIDGNDGGMGISYDMGKTWRHITNLPAGQFYHINVDMELPYRIYGGLQDNGSWVGPAYSWHNGGLINEFWDFILSGDGFDAMPVASDPRYCYAQSQGGALRFIDLLTGNSKNIRPAPETGERLRFNWNAALAQDPFDNNTVYFGSQFLHKSTDRGNSWQKISPDLTTNDPEKQNQSKSGGITPDITGAESHCTILTISPSKLSKGLIWIGTDDGNVQYTNDGGKTWINVTDNIKGAPKKAWIPQITASEHNPDEAFVVINNYRLGDYSAYLYHTNNYGKTWERLIDNNDVWGYVLCFVQDPVEPALMFAGTEYGLYASFDRGETWNKWSVGYPTVSTYDMVIHPRENDLVIGTFGRSIWIIDDIVPLREVARTGGKVLNEKIAVFNAPPAIMAYTKNLPGYYYRGDAYYQGENRPLASIITFYINEKTGEKIKLEILDEDGSVIRNLEADAQKGFNRIQWRFDRDPVPTAGLIQRSQQSATQSERMARFSGIRALPGEYTVKITYNGSAASAKAKILYDPRMPEPDLDAMKKNYRRGDEIASKIYELNGLYQKFTEFNAIITKIDELASKNIIFAEVIREFHNPLKEKYQADEKRLTGREEGLFMKINASRVLFTATGELDENQEKTVREAFDAMKEAKMLLEEFISKDWPEYQKKLTEKSVPVEAVIR
ncbi:MAG: VPS10 domain-containing protein [Bacteroidales bacterium]